MSATSAARALLGSWALEGLGWFALRETSMRLSLEGGILVLLTALRLTPLVLIASWLVLHTVCWFFLYGGYEKIGSLSGRATGMATLLAFRDEVIRQVRATRAFRAAFLVGSSARNELTEHSDIDILIVPGTPFPRAILSLWALRANAVLQRLPLGAGSVDVERYIPLRLADEPRIVLKGTPDAPKFDPRVGVLVSLSGIDGSGKTTAAKRLVERLDRTGIPARYFYGHRPFYREGELRLSGALLLKGVWHRLGRSAGDLRRYPSLTLALGLLTFLDYIVVQLRLSRVLQPGTFVVADRYVADVIVYLRALGVRRRAVEGLLTGISFPPAVSLLFEIDPRVAGLRKAEESWAELDRHVREYTSLVPRLGLVPIDADVSVDEVCNVALEHLRRVVDVRVA